MRIAQDVSPPPSSCIPTPEQIIPAPGVFDVTLDATLVPTSEEAQDVPPPSHIPTPEPIIPAPGVLDGTPDATLVPTSDGPSSDSSIPTFDRAVDLSHVAPITTKSSSASGSGSGVAVDQDANNK